jgi:hypothetical protein
MLLTDDENEAVWRSLPPALRQAQTIRKHSTAVSFELPPLTERLSFLIEVALLEALSTCLPQGAHVFRLEPQHEGCRVFPHAALTQVRHLGVQDEPLVSDTIGDVIVVSDSFDLGCVSWSEWDMPRVGRFSGELTLFGARFPGAFNEVMAPELSEWLGRPR